MKNADSPKEEKVLEWRGSYGGEKEQELIVIKNKDHWQHFSEKLLKSKEIPKIDFSRSMVIAVFMGERRTGGYGVNIVSAREVEGLQVMEQFIEEHRNKTRIVSQLEKKVFAVEYEEISPGPGTFVTQAFTTPFHIKVVKRSDQPVVFVRYAIKH